MSPDQIFEEMKCFDEEFKQQSSQMLSSNEDNKQEQESMFSTVIEQRDNPTELATTMMCEDVRADQSTVFVGAVPVFQKQTSMQTALAVFSPGEEAKDED